MGEPGGVGGGGESGDELMHGAGGILRRPWEPEHVRAEARHVLGSLGKVQAQGVDADGGERGADAGVAAGEKCVGEADQGGVAEEGEDGCSKAEVENVERNGGGKVVVLGMGAARLRLERSEAVLGADDERPHGRLVEVEVLVELIDGGEVRLQAAGMDHVLVTQEGKVAEDCPGGGRQGGEVVLGAEVEEAENLAAVADPRVVAARAGKELVEAGSEGKMAGAEVVGELAA